MRPFPNPALAAQAVAAPAAAATAAAAAPSVESAAVAASASGAMSRKRAHEIPSGDEIKAKRQSIAPASRPISERIQTRAITRQASSSSEQAPMSQEEPVVEQTTIDMLEAKQQGRRGSTKRSAPPAATAPAPPAPLCVPKLLVGRVLPGMVPVKSEVRPSARRTARQDISDQQLKRRRPKNEGDDDSVAAGATVGGASSSSSGWSLPHTRGRPPMAAALVVGAARALASIRDPALRSNPLDQTARLAEVCGTQPAGAGLPQTQACPGQSEALRKLLGETENGHDIYVHDISDKTGTSSQDLGSVIMCHVCAAWATTGGYARKLSQKCAGKLDGRAAQESYARAASGRYPHSSKSHLALGATSRVTPL
mmetsp:Transcript_63998/g.208817  ORF Transcript_63998/g.208817 Transcript_63998/m.208817 type:complete len:368 (+) Transcript_63998:2146-3249(+)